MTAGLTRQEILRTLGMLLDISSTRNVRIVLSERGAEISGSSWQWQSSWSMDDLAAESEDQRGWQSYPRRDSTPRAGPVTQCLRALGAAIEDQGPGPFVIEVADDMARVQGPRGYEATLPLHAAAPPGTNPTPILNLNRAEH